MWWWCLHDGARDAAATAVVGADAAALAALGLDDGAGGGGDGRGGRGRHRSGDGWFTTFVRAYAMNATGGEGLGVECA